MSVTDDLLEALHAVTVKERDDARAEVEHLRRDLAETHDALVGAVRAIEWILRRSGDRQRNARLRADGACVSCADEAQPGRTRCRPCGQKNSRRTCERQRERRPA